MEVKECSRCKVKVICNKLDIENCECSQVELSKETRLHLSKTSFDCLCNNCLIYLNKVVNIAEEVPKPSESELLIPKIHFYREGSNMVFTELFHIQKGFCCQNSCRHCPYN